MFKRLLSMVLAVSMVLSLCPMTFAAETDQHDHDNGLAVAAESSGPSWYYWDFDAIQTTTSTVNSVTTGEYKGYQENKISSTTGTIIKGGTATQATDKAFVFETPISLRKDLPWEVEIKANVPSSGWMPLADTESGIGANGKFIFYYNQIVSMCNTDSGFPGSGSETISGLHGTTNTIRLVNEVINGHANIRIFVNGIYKGILDTYTRANQHQTTKNKTYADQDFLFTYFSAYSDTKPVDLDYMKIRECIHTRATLTAGKYICDYCGQECDKPVMEPNSYYWDFDAIQNATNTVNSITTGGYAGYQQNAITGTNTTNTIGSNGMVTRSANSAFEFEKPIDLRKDMPWEVEIKAKAPNGWMPLADTVTGIEADGRFIFYYNKIVAMGNKDNAADNYPGSGSATISDLATATKTIRLVNEVINDHANVRIYVDGVYMGLLNTKTVNNSPSTTADKTYADQNFLFNYFSAYNATASVDLDYMKIRECTHTSATVVEGKYICDYCGQECDKPVMEANSYYWNFDQMAAGTTKIETVEKNGYAYNYLDNATGQLGAEGVVEAEKTQGLKLGKPVFLHQDLPWVVEVKGQSNRRWMILNERGYSATTGETYLWVFDGIVMGKFDGGAYKGSSLKAGLYNKNVTIRLENVIKANGGHEVQVYIDDAYYGILDRDFNGGFTTEKNTNYVDVDACFSVFASMGFTGDMDHLLIQECAHTKATVAAGVYYCDYCGNQCEEPETKTLAKNYYWNFAGMTAADEKVMSSITGDYVGYDSNYIDNTSGGIKAGGTVAMTAGAQLGIPVALRADFPWVFEIEGNIAERWMPLTQSAAGGQTGEYYLFIHTEGVQIGTLDGAYKSTSIPVQDLLGANHKIRLENVILETGHEVRAYVDGKYVGIVEVFAQGGETVGTIDTSYVDRDLSFTHFGAWTPNGTLKHMLIQECAHTHSTPNAEGNYICNFCNLNLGAEDIHNYVKDRFVWSEDKRSCSLKVTCVNCGNPGQDISATVSTRVAAGENRAIATAYLNGIGYTDVVKTGDNTYIAQDGNSSTYYATLKEAFEKGGSVIRLLDGAVISSDITVPYGKTLLLPHSANDVNGLNGTLAHDTVGAKGVSQIGPGAYSSVAWNDPATYRYMVATINSDVTVTVKGTLTVGGILYTADQTSQTHTSGNYAHLINNGTIVLEKSGNNAPRMNAPGYVTGSGEIKLGSNGILKLPFLINDFEGGSLMYALNDESSFLAMNDFGINNVQCKMSMEYGAKVKGYGSIYAGSQSKFGLMDVGLIGPDGEKDSKGKDVHYLLYMMPASDEQPASALETSYDASATVAAKNGVNTTDFGKLTITITAGVVQGGSFHFSYTPTIGFEITATTKGKYLPIPYTMDIVVADGATLTLPQSEKTDGFAVMPGSKIEVQKGGTLNVDGKLQVLDGWNKAVVNGQVKRYPTSLELKKSGFSASGELIVDGIMNINGMFAGIVQTTGISGEIVIASNAKLQENFKHGTKDYEKKVGGYVFKTDITVDNNLVEYSMTARVHNGQNIVDLQQGNTYYAAGSETWPLESFTMTGHIISANADSNGVVTIQESMNGTWSNVIHEHTPDEAVVENEENATFDKEGSYDLVIYCEKCGEEISREIVTTPILVCIAKNITTGKQYLDLVSAIKEASANDVVQLQANIDVTSPIVISEGKSVKVDLNGKIITYSSTVFQIFGTVNLDLNGGSISTSTTTETGYYAIDVASTGCLSISGTGSITHNIGVGKNYAAIHNNGTIEKITGNVTITTNSSYGISDEGGTIKYIGGENSVINISGVASGIKLDGSQVNDIGGENAQIMISVTSESVAARYAALRMTGGSKVDNIGTDGATVNLTGVSYGVYLQGSTIKNLGMTANTETGTKASTLNLTATAENTDSHALLVDNGATVTMVGGNVDFEACHYVVNILNGGSIGTVGTSGDKVTVVATKPTNTVVGFFVKGRIGTIGGEGSTIEISGMEAYNALTAYAILPYGKLVDSDGEQINNVDLIGAANSTITITGESSGEAPLHGVYVGNGAAVGAIGSSSASITITDNATTAYGNGVYVTDNSSVGSIGNGANISIDSYNGIYLNKGTISTIGNGGNINITSHYGVIVGSQATKIGAIGGDNGQICIHATKTGIFNNATIEEIKDNVIVIVTEGNAYAVENTGDSATIGEISGGKYFHHYGRGNIFSAGLEAKVSAGKTLSGSKKESVTLSENEVYDCYFIEAADHKHNFKSVETRPTWENRGYTTHTCTVCTDSWTDSYTEVKTSYNILMVGNSFSWDAADFWYDMTESMTYNAMKSMLDEQYDVHLGVLYTGAATLSYHASNAKGNLYRYNYSEIGPDTDYTWTPSDGRTHDDNILDQLKARDWDIIVIQGYQHDLDGVKTNEDYTVGSYEDDFATTDKSVPYLLDYFAEYEPGAEVYFYMPLATTKNYDGVGIKEGKTEYPENYVGVEAGYAGMAQYVKNTIMPMTGTNSGLGFTGLIPVGTGIQNARTTYFNELKYTGIGSTNLQKDPQKGLQYDNQHLSFGIGRYIAGLIVAETLIPQELRKETYSYPLMKDSPSAGEMPAEYTEIAQMAAAAALENPYQITTITGYETDLADRVCEVVASGSYSGNEEALLAQVTEMIDQNFDGLGDMSVNLQITQAATDHVDGLATVTIRVGYTTRTVQITVSATGHIYGEPAKDAWVWTGSDEAGYTAATVTLACEECDDTQEVNAVVTSVTEDPTETADGKTVYTATAKHGEATYVATKEVVIPATGPAVCEHTGGTATCSAQAVCDVCKQAYGELAPDNHVNTTNINAKDATCVEDGYTGDIFCNDCKTTIAYGETIPATGHSYGEPEWIWTGDDTNGYTAATATFTCACGDEEIVTDSEIAKETTEATAETDGKTVYTAEVSFKEGTYTATKTVVIPATGAPECEHAAAEAVKENEVASTWEKVGGYDMVVYCSKCGEEMSRESHAALLNPFYNNSMVLANNLTISLNIKKDTLDAEELSNDGYYAVVTRIDANGVRHETEIPMSEWRVHTKNRYQIYFNKLSAKEMSDELELVLYNSDGEQVTVVYEISVREHAMSEIEQYLELGGYDKFVTLMVDMLNYGAAAQKYLNYNTDNLANSMLTAEHQSYATGNAVPMENIDKSGFAAYQNTNMDLKNNMVLNMVFWKDAFGVDISQVVAKVTYAHHSTDEGIVLEETINGTDFDAWTSKNGRERCKLAIDWLVIADGDQEITVTFYDLAGNELGGVSESLSAALGTFIEAQPSEELWPAMLKFMRSAYIALH